MVTYIYENTHNNVLSTVNRLYLNKAGFGGKNKQLLIGMTMHTCNPSTQQNEAGGSSQF